MKQRAAALIAVLMSATALQAGQTFCVDPAKGDDTNRGSVDAPFKTLQHALELVDGRAKKGILSDKILLRAGVYKRAKPMGPRGGSRGLWMLNLRGTPRDHAVLSAMPAKANAPGAVRRKSGKWYERVVFDDGQVVKGPWEKMPGTQHIWQCKPGFRNGNWIKGDREIKRRYGYSTRTRPGAQFCVLQDGEPLLWANCVTPDSRKLANMYDKDLTSRQALAPGYRAYDVDEATLYVWLRENKNPNDCLIEAWTGDRYRSIFKGALKYATIRGMEFRLFENVYKGEAAWEPKPSTLQYILWEDTDFFYGHRGIMYDHALFDVPWDPKPKRNVSYQESHHWHIRYNRFYRISGEALQPMGEGNIVEYNEFIEKGHPSFGPKIWVSTCNWRSCTALIVRGNYVYGGNPGSKAGGYTFVFESTPPVKLRKGPPPRDGEFVFEYNVFLNNSSKRQQATTFEIGKGTGVFKNMVIRHNIFAHNKNHDTIGISTPHENLRIHNNIFYNERIAIDHTGDHYKRAKKGNRFGDVPSTVLIKDNIFVGCGTAIDKALVKPKPTDKVVIDRNLFFDCAPAGRNAIVGKDPLFRDPAKLDFRVQTGSPAIVAGHDIGMYDLGSPVAKHADWWAFAADGIPTTIR